MYASYATSETVWFCPGWRRVSKSGFKVVAQRPTRTCTLSSGYASSTSVPMDVPEKPLKESKDMNMRALTVVQVSTFKLPWAMTSAAGSKSNFCNHVLSFG